jgi:hypothetical protein
MTWTPWREVRVAAAAAFAAVAVVLLGAAVRSAFRNDPVDAGPPLEIRSSTESAARTPRFEPTRLSELNPFDASRAAPDEPASDPPPITPQVFLVGTVLGGVQPAAICRAGDELARILHLGDTISGWRLVEIAPARAVFIDAAGARHELRLLPPGT